ncbi:hypothetical protein A0H81_08706 [Grifola frondosa]|uniref:Histidine-specific methyltransferase SAM-dependent domain-containing protein n=1 Tax=Grifola frondosa TaxID=5627 RepID=A0A1C7M2M3_GRIFR|nr:hypothetical protein A0H81_08706 [Grifola frondosa]
MSTLQDFVHIVDLRANQPTLASSVIHEQVVSGLSQPTGQKWLPTMLLYDERGLRLYDAITTEAPEYYLFPAEEEILKNRSSDIVRVMHARNGNAEAIEEVVVELGAGALRKTSHILRALSQHSMSSVQYYALDLEKRELERTLKTLNDSEIGAEIKDKVSTKGLCGTYDDGLKFIAEGGLEGRNDLERITTEVSEQYKLERVGGDDSPRSASSSRTPTTETEVTPPSTPGFNQPLHILFLGSSLGNFTRGEDAAFLRSLPLRPGSGDTLLLGLDHDNEAHQIELAYNDPKGITKNFIMNGLKCAGRALGDEHSLMKTNGSMSRYTMKNSVVMRLTTSQRVSKRLWTQRLRSVSRSKQTSSSASNFLQVL